MFPFRRKSKNVHKKQADGNPATHPLRDQDQFIASSFFLFFLDGADGTVRKVHNLLYEVQTGRHVK